MNAEIIILILSTVISLIAVALSYYTFQRTLRSSSRPILIFSLRSETLWQLQNVGNGPAINILVGEMNNERQWVNVTNCYPLATGASVPLLWLRHGVQLATVYTDIYGRSLTTHCASNWNKVTNKNEFPHWQADNHEVIQVIIAKGSRVINEEELKGLTPFELDVKRNEIYARHRYIFTRADLAEHFKKQGWYKPDSADRRVVESRLSDEERAAANYILFYQNRHGLRTASREKLKQPNS